MNEPISSREVSEMLRRYSEMVAAHSVLLGVDRESVTAELLYEESRRAAELASYFWNSNHDLREHYVARKAVLGDLFPMKDYEIQQMPRYLWNYVYRYLTTGALG